MTDPTPTPDTSSTIANGPNPYDKFTEDSSAQYDTRAVRKAKFEYTKARAEIDLDRERWKNRRRMAWLAMWSMIIAVIVMFTVVPESKITKLDEIVSWFMMAMASVVGTYIGTTTWAYVSTNRKGHSSSYNNPYDNYGGGRLDNADDQDSRYYAER